MIIFLKTYWKRIASVFAISVALAAGDLVVKDETTLYERLSTMTPAERMATKNAELAKVGQIAKERVSSSDYDYEIQIVSVTTTEFGIDVFARAWEPGRGQIGFGADRSVDIERFHISNAPILVPDINGKITRTITTKDGNSVISKYREDPKRALQEVIANAVKMKKQKSVGSNIAVGKIGNSTTIAYPQAGHGGSNTTSDQAVERYLYPSLETFAALIAGAGTATDAEAGNTNVDIHNEGNTAGQFTGVYRFGMTFSTSAIGTDTVTSAIFAEKGSNSYRNDFAGGDTFAKCVVAFTPAANNNFVASDYSNFGSTLLSNRITYNGFQKTGWNYYTLSATSGLSAINKTGITGLGLRNNWDLDGAFGGTWAGPSKYIWLNGYSADTAGTTSDPVLTVEHGAIGGATGYSHCVLGKCSPTYFNGMPLTNTSKVQGL